MCYGMWNQTTKIVHATLLNSRTCTISMETVWFGWGVGLLQCSDFLFSSWLLSLSLSQIQFNCFFSFVFYLNSFQFPFCLRLFLLFGGYVVLHFMCASMFQSLFLMLHHFSSCKLNLNVIVMVRDWYQRGVISNCCLVVNTIHLALMALPHIAGRFSILNQQPPCPFAE